jgi:hypothetical protein
MAFLCIQGDTVTAVNFTPSNPAVTATAFVTVGTNKDKIIVEGDLVDTHTNFTPNPNIIHSDAAIASEKQSFFKISEKFVILNEDESTCDSTHIILAASQNFINVIPK